jgi:hypothetical protein
MTAEVVTISPDWEVYEATSDPVASAMSSPRPRGGRGAPAEAGRGPGNEPAAWRI